MLVASGGQEALLIAESTPAPLHLLITGVFLPELDGRAVAEALRRNHPETRVLCVSGYTRRRRPRGGAGVGDRAPAQALHRVVAAGPGRPRRALPSLEAEGLSAQVTADSRAGQAGDDVVRT